uniref:Uncharacterized protein n=1 Tax=Anguilla anguilla TaxID=7936 RepID=A0A0E9QGQ5_ANGAN
MCSVLCIAYDLCLSEDFHGKYLPRLGTLHFSYLENLAIASFPQHSQQLKAFWANALTVPVHTGTSQLHFFCLSRISFFHRNVTLVLLCITDVFRLQVNVEYPGHSSSVIQNDTILPVASVLVRECLAMIVSRYLF